MGILLWLLVGGAVGWLAGLLMRDDNGLIGNIVVGVVGAFLGGLLFARGDINNSPLTAETFGVSLIGAVILLALVNLVRRHALR